MKILKILFILIISIIIYSCTISKRSLSESNFSILTYNIHHANPPSLPNRIEIDSICEVIKNSGSDIITLQEVDMLTQRSNNLNQIKIIANKLNLKY